MATFVAVALSAVLAMAGLGLGLRGGILAFGTIIVLAVMLHFVAP